MMQKFNTKLIVAVGVALIGAGIGAQKAYAGCTANYGGGETCVFNKRFDIEKKVRKEGDDSWKDKVTSVKENQVVEFRVKVKNEGEVEVDDMKMKDFLPKEMEKVGGSGLTEYWDSFEPGESKTFVIKAVVKDSEYDRKNFEKCVVNKARVEYKGDNEGSDTATVCYSDKEPTELPKTGGESALIGALGLGLASLGVTIKKVKAKILKAK
ncbi:TPA: hypothetical protein DCY43_01540 [candidate division WWE3 bacterium]|uniref:DUF11 domain-containing protein n=4 Tax=Katanobacteria TaxID=422282 RepID=A0A0G1MVK9_UNCKA|nr:MAG: hypothetical protein UW82_C0010G0015 [candidate division WWE3 bacterium GW2011_GWC2_44_9]HAZ29421.1 hypothetical protein [candidate division WWE3 bacterium]